MDIQVTFLILIDCFNKNIGDPFHIPHPPPGRRARSSRHSSYTTEEAESGSLYNGKVTSVAYTHVHDKWSTLRKKSTTTTE